MRCTLPVVLFAARPVPVLAVLVVELRLVVDDDDSEPLGILLLPGDELGVAISAERRAALRRRPLPLSSSPSSVSSPVV